MATTIKLKNGSGAPSASDLVQGEPAIDLTNKRLYTENDSGAVIEVGSNPSSLSIAGTAITATAAELNILDGVTSTAAELNILDGVTSTAAELNILDGVTSTATELNIVDGDTTATSTTLADADRVVVNDAGTMVQVALTDFETYFESALDTLSNVTTVGALNAGSITSGFGAIDNGSSAITTTGTVTYGSLSDGTITVTAFVDEDDMSSDSATLVPTQQSVKAYVDAQVTAEDLDFQADSGGALSIDLDSETMTFTGGTGIDTSGAGNAVTFAIDSTVTTLTGSQTLTNKTLTSPVLNTGVSGTAVLDEDDMSSDSATQLATQQSIKAYVDSQVASADTLAELTDTNVTSPADGALLFYDTGTSKWIDNVVSGDITIADTGVAAIGSGVIVNDDVNASAAISVSKTALAAGTGLTLSTNTLSVDASQTQITAVGTIGTGTWQGSVISDTYVANDLTISGGTIENTIIGAATAAAGTFTTFTSTGIDDNATSTAITIDSSENVGIGSASNHAGARVVINDTPPTAFGSPMFQVGQETFTSSGYYSIGLGFTNGTYTEPPAEIAAVSTSSSGGTTADIVFGTRSVTTNTAVTERMRINSSGNVLIGRTVATLGGGNGDDLQIGSGSGGAGLTIHSSTSSNGDIQFSDGTSGDSSYRGLIRYRHADDELDLWTAGARRVTLDSSGNVGIGTDSPARLFEVAGNNNAGAKANYLRITDTDTTATSNNQQGGIEFYASDASAGAGVNASIEVLYAGSGGGGEITFNTAANSGYGVAEAMRIDENGNVGIGNTSPASQSGFGTPLLEVRGSSGGTLLSTNSTTGLEAAFVAFSTGINIAAAGAATASTGNNIVFRTGSTNSNYNSAERMRIDSSGNLLVGKTTSGYTVTGAEIQDSGDVIIKSVGAPLVLNRDTAGPDATIQAFYLEDTLAGIIAVTKGGTPAFAASSDIRLKDNVTAHESELSNVMSLRPVRWDWKDETKGAGEGFVAQELEQTAWADLVSDGEDGYKMVSGLGTVETRLIKALQEAVTRIETLEAEVAALKGE